MMLRSVRPQKLHRNWPGSLPAYANNSTARSLGVLPVIRKDSQCHLLGRGTPFLASVRLTLADEKRGARFNPGERRDNGSTSEDVHPHLLIQKPGGPISDL